jgi:pyruvate/2-oxoglutarate dehydrogenase complex dihydrolipoamide acyltransferase (E2) component
METFLIDVPMPSMGATVNELTVIALKTQVGDRVTKGQRLADLESDKSVFEFESPCDGTIRAVLVNAGDVKPAGEPFLQIETADDSLRHLQARAGVQPGTAALPGPAAAKPAAALVWTPRAVKMAQEAGLDPSTITAIEATGPGGRVSGDDVMRYLAARKS